MFATLGDGYLQQNVVKLSYSYHANIFTMSDLLDHIHVFSEVHTQIFVLTAFSVDELF